MATCDGDASGLHRRVQHSRNQTALGGRAASLEGVAPGNIRSGRSTHGGQSRSKALPERPRMHPRVVEVIQEWELRELPRLGSGTAHSPMYALWEDSQRCAGPDGQLCVVLAADRRGQRTKKKSRLESNQKSDVASQAS